MLNAGVTVTAATVRRERDRRLRSLRLRLGDELRQYRLDAGLTLTELATITGIDRSHLARVEGGVATPSLDALAAMSVALGVDLSIRCFPGTGPRLVDRFQAPMIESFLRGLHPRWSARLEVPVLTPVRGVIDAVIRDREAPTIVSTEFQSEFRRIEQQIRWNNEKALGLAVDHGRDGKSTQIEVSTLLVLRSTVATREVARTYEATLRSAFPAPYAAMLSALRSASAPWPGSGLLWMRVENGSAVLLDRPPRGVRVGRS
jgi:transcriptional regulator with XRE-family HTH domain